jgi:predicted GNAT family acetyltransferase
MRADFSQVKVKQNKEVSRFEVYIDDAVAFIEYKLFPGKIVFVHTEVPSTLEGRGIAAQLAKAGLEFASQEGLRVIPICPFVASYLKRHPEYFAIVDQNQIPSESDQSK